MLVEEATDHVAEEIVVFGEDAAFDHVGENSLRARADPRGVGSSIARRASLRKPQFRMMPMLFRQMEFDVDLART